jgi:hypothetical protein
MNELRETLRTGALNINRGTIGQSIRLPVGALGRSGSGVTGGAELLRVLTVPRAGMTQKAPFTTQSILPGVGWLDDEEEADLGGSLELAVE